MICIVEKSKSVLFVFALALYQIGSVANGENFYTELEELNPLQRQALATFKQLVTPILPEDYMKEDIYLIKYLKFNSFKIQPSVQHLKDVLEWREQENVEEKGKNPPEDLIALGRDYPAYVDGYDKEGRPICEIPFGAWSVRKAAAAGLMKKLIAQFLIGCQERAAVKVRELQAQGKNVTQFVVIANMEGFSVTDHLCPACLPLPVTLAVGNDKYFPNMAAGWYLVNTPDAFAAMFRLIRPIMSAATRAATKVFTNNEAEWRPFLEERVDFNQISDYLGGGKVRNFP